MGEGEGEGEGEGGEEPQSGFLNSHTLNTVVGSKLKLLYHKRQLK